MLFAFLEKHGTNTFEMGDGRWERGDGRWEMGVGRWERGNWRGEWLLITVHFWQCFETVQVSLQEESLKYQLSIQDF